MINAATLEPWSQIFATCFGVTIIILIVNNIGLRLKLRQINAPYLEKMSRYMNGELFPDYRRRTRLMIICAAAFWIAGAACAIYVRMSGNNRSPEVTNWVGAVNCDPGVALRYALITDV